MARTPVTNICLLGLALVSAGCGGGNDEGSGNAATAGPEIEEAGPMGGGTGMGTSGEGAASPIGEVDNGNVAPANLNPENPRPGTDPAAGASQ